MLGLVGCLISNNKSLTFNLGFNALLNTDVLVYLGINFKLGRFMSVDCSSRRRKLLGSVCSVLRHKCIGYEDVFAKILVSKCLPILNYGMDCICLDSKSTNVIAKSWNNAFRWLFNLKKLIQL
jgi:hypothetical protein